MLVYQRVPPTIFLAWFHAMEIRIFPISGQGGFLDDKLWILCPQMPIIHRRPGSSNHRKVDKTPE